MKKTTLFILFYLLLSTSLWAQTQNQSQPQILPIDTFTFTNFQENALTYDSVSSLLIPFFAKFDTVVSTGKGNINIVHIGGSHIQAGTFPDRIRTNLLTAYPESVSRRGMIFPYSVAKKCNNPIDYSVSKQGEFGLVRNVYQNIERPLGVTGIAVYPTDTIADIKISLKSYPRYETNKIYLLGYSDFGTITPSIIMDTISYLPVEIDTISRRYVYEVPTFVDSFYIHIPVDSVDIFTLTGVFLDNEKPGISYHSLGVNGASVPSFLKCEYFAKDLELLQPDLVIFGLGVNDASSIHFDTVEYAKNYLQLVDKIKSINPQCAFIFVTNNDNFSKVSRGKYTVNKRSLMVQEQLHRLAKATQGGVWDMFHIMGGLRSMEKWKTESLAKTDRIHFTNAGYNLLGDLFYNAFIQAMEKSTKNAQL